MTATAPTDPAKGPATAAKTAFETLSTRFGAVATGAVASLIIARALGPEGRGEYVYPIFVVGLFAVAGHLSYDFINIHLRSIKAADERTLALAAFAISGVAGLATLAVFATVALTVPALFAGIHGKLVLAAAATLPLLIQQHALTSVLVVSFRMRAVNAATLAGAVAQLLAIIALAALGRLTPLGVLCVAAASTAITWGVLFGAVRPPVGLPPAYLVRHALRYAWRIHIGGIIMVLMWRGDVLFVKGFLGVREVGLYTLAVFLAEMLLSLVEATTAAATPRQVLSEAPDQFAGAVHRLGIMTLTAGGLALAAISPVLVPMLYGSAFSDTITPLLILLPGLVLFGAYRPLAVFLLRLQRPLRFTGAAAIALVVNVVGNLLVVERWGIEGVAAITSVTYAVLYLLIAAWFLAETKLPWRTLIPSAADGRLLFSLLRRA